MSQKPVVHYSEVGEIVVGRSTVVVTTDHPSYWVTNGMPAVTSRVIRHELISGEFETEQTIYRKAETI